MDVGGPHGVDEYPGPTPLELVVEHPRPGVTVLAVSGEVDLATAPLLSGALEAVDDRLRHLVIDLRGVRFFSGAGVSALLSARERAARGAFALHLTGVTGNRPVDVVLTLTATTAQFTVHRDVAAALAAIGGG